MYLIYCPNLDGDAFIKVVLHPDVCKVWKTFGVHNYEGKIVENHLVNKAYCAVEDLF